MDRKYRTGGGGVYYVDYFCLDERGVRFWNNTNRSCYADIFHGFIPEKAKQIVVNLAIKDIPFGKKAIRRLILIMNRAGFPCRHEYQQDRLHLITPTDGYKKKVHILSTLTLFRLLYEPGINQALEILFWNLDKRNRKSGVPVDYALELGEAHCKKGYEQLDGYFNSGHAVTYRANGAPPSGQELFANFEKSYVGVFAGGNPGVNAAWKKRL